MGNLNRKILMEDVDTALLIHVQHHLSQAQGTAFTDETINEALGKYTESTTAKIFRQGKIDSLTQLQHPKMTKILEYLKPQESDPHPLDKKLTLNQLKSGFRIWAEKTSTSLRGRTLGIYKMWLHQQQDPNNDMLPGDEFFSLFLGIINVSKTLQHHFRRWKTVHNIFILKEPNNYNIKRLRTLYKIDAELNLI